MIELKSLEPKADGVTMLYTSESISELTEYYDSKVSDKEELVKYLIEDTIQKVEDLWELKLTFKY